MLTPFHLQQDHLVCFLAASLMLGVTDGTGPVPPDTSAFTDDEQDDFFAGKALLRTCVNTYAATETGLAPEVRFFVHHRGTRYTHLTLRIS